MLRAGVPHRRAVFLFFEGGPIGVNMVRGSERRLPEMTFEPHFTSPIQSKTPQRNGQQILKKGNSDHSTLFRAPFFFFVANCWACAPCTLPNNLRNRRGSFHHAHHIRPTSLATRLATHHQYIANLTLFITRNPLRNPVALTITSLGCQFPSSVDGPTRYAVTSSSPTTAHRARFPTHSCQLSSRQADLCAQPTTRISITSFVE